MGKLILFGQSLFGLAGFLSQLPFTLMASSSDFGKHRSSTLNPPFQLAKNFLNSALVSVGRCSISQCPVSVNMIEVTLVATSFACV